MYEHHAISEDSTDNSKIFVLNSSNSKHNKWSLDQSMNGENVCVNDGIENSRLFDFNIALLFCLFGK